MKLEHRNLLIDLIPKLFERPNFENLVKRIGYPDILDEVPGNASFKDAATFIVDRAISAGWAPALVAATREEFPARRELDELDVSAPPVNAPPPPDTRWWRKPGVLAAIAGGAGVGITLLVIAMWPRGSSSTKDAGVPDARIDAPPLDAPPDAAHPPPHIRFDAGIDAPTDAKIVVPLRDGGVGGWRRDGGLIILRRDGGRIPHGPFPVDPRDPHP